MTKYTERQRARLKARTRCLSGNKLRLRDVIVRPKTLKTYHLRIQISLFLLCAIIHRPGFMLVRVH